MNLNITNTVNTIKLLNSERMYIANGCYQIVSLYNRYTIDEWTGTRRKLFHEKMFGTSYGKIEGYIGKIINMCISDKLSLNELLYLMINHVIKIVESDENQTVNLTLKDFTDDSISLNQVSLDVSYSNIDETQINTPSDNFENFKSSILNIYQSEVRTHIDNFITNLYRLPELVFDNTTKDITRQAAILNDMILEYQVKIKILLEDISNFGVSTKRLLDQTIATNEAFINKMGSSDLFD